MHTVKVIGAGIALLGVFLLAGRLLGRGEPGALATAAKAFIPVWFLAAAINMWMGVSRAGYSVHDELPFLFVNFAVPAAIAAIVLWRI
jgi:hypothetical protein